MEEVRARGTHLHSHLRIHGPRRLLLPLVGALLALQGGAGI